MASSKRREKKTTVPVSPDRPLTLAATTRLLAKGVPLVRRDWASDWRSCLQGLADGLAVVEDPRDNRGLKHPLVSVLVIAVISAVCGADDAENMNLWAVRERTWLETILDLPHGIPSQDTILRVLAAIDPDALTKGFLGWVEHTMGPDFAYGLHVGIDGKTARRSGGGRGNTKPVHVVSAMVAEHNMVIGQVAIAEKSNEITAIPKLLRLLSIKGALVSIDAMGCQVEIARVIRSKGADYLLATKKNQGSLRTDLETAFEYALTRGQRAVDDAKPLSLLSASSVDGDHGRIEERTAYVIRRADDPGAFDRWLPSSKRWLDIASIVCVDAKRTHIKTNKTSTERRYFISSRSLTPEGALAGVRAHWAIENGLHWVLDVVFGEDHCRVRTKNAAQNLVTLRHIAHGLLRRHTGDKISVAKRRTLCDYFPGYREFLLGSPHVLSEG